MDGIKYRPVEEMKDSGVEWLGIVPKDWRFKPIKYCYSFITGGTPPSGNENYYDSNGYKWATIKDMEGRKIYDTKNYVSEKGVKVANLILNKRGSLLYSFKLSVGQVAFLEDDMYTNEAIATFGVNNKNSLAYLYYAAPIYIVKNANVNIYGAKLLNQELINNAKILIPKIPEQQKIANFLDIKTTQFDSIIAKKELFIQKLEETKKSLISEVVTGKVKIVDGEMVSRQPEEMKDSGVEWLGMIPRNWEVGTIGKFYLIQLGKMLQPNRKSKTETLEYYLCSTNVSWDGIRTDLLKQMWFTPQERKKYLLNRGDLLVIEGGDVGVACIWNNELEECYIQNALHKVTPLEMSTNKFLYYWLFTLKTYGYIDLICNKATISHFTKEKFSKSLFLLPSRSEQKAIIDFLDDQCFRLDYFKTQNVKVIEKLKQAKHSLISEAVTGKIDLRDWEIIEEGGA